jgi:hypothetical protein
MTVVRYMLLIYSNAASWDAMTDVERLDLSRGHRDLVAALQDSGELVHGAGLDDESLTTTVRVSRDDEIEATDGPFLEAKEHLAGYYVVDVADRDRAVAIAARMPDAKYVAVEVRPLLTRLSERTR